MRKCPEFWASTVLGFDWSKSESRRSLGAPESSSVQVGVKMLNCSALIGPTKEAESLNWLVISELVGVIKALDSD